MPAPPVQQRQRHVLLGAPLHERDDAVARHVVLTLRLDEGAASWIRHDRGDRAPAGTPEEI